MAEKLNPPQGPWEKQYDEIGLKYVCSGPTDPITGVNRSWEKRLLDGDQIVNCFDRFPNGQDERWVLNIQRADGVQIHGYTLLDRTRHHQTIQYVERDSISGSIRVSSELEEAKRPAFLNLASAESAYLTTGELALICLYFDSQSHFNEVEIRGRTTEENLTHLAGFFKGEGTQVSLPFMITGMDPVEAFEAYKAAANMAIQGKVLRWLEDERRLVDADLEIIPRAVLDVCRNLTPDQMELMADILAIETVKRLPDSYPAMERKIQTDTFDKAFENAIVECFKLHDETLQMVAQHRVEIVASQKLHLYGARVIQGHLQNPIREKPKALAEYLGPLGTYFTYEDREIGVMEEGKFIAVSVKSKFNKEEVILLLTEPKLNPRVGSLIITPHISDWWKAFDLLGVNLQILPYPDS